MEDRMETVRGLAGKIKEKYWPPGKDQLLILHVAAMPPYRIMDACGRALALLEDMADKGSRQLLSDVACGAVFCRAAMQGASLTLFANTTSMKDRARAEELETACDELLDTWLPRADALARRASDAARKRG